MGPASHRKNANFTSVFGHEVDTFPGQYRESALSKQRYQQMRIRRSTARALAVVTAFMFIAAACGGGSVDDAATDGDPNEDQDTATVVGVIPTTAPLTAPADDESTASAGGADADISDVLSDDDPWEVTVLHVNDDVQIIPVFDGVNGNNIKLFDQNEIDGSELEYPLYAETVFGNRLALLVEEYDSTGAWARVQMPIRPNGTTAWVQTGFFREEKHNYHIVIDVSENTVNVYQGEELLVEQIAVSGRESRPTPVVRSYIDEKIPGASLSPAYGDWVLSIAAFSETLGTFGGGGMPKLALHGTNQPELMGQYVSSGCVRIPNEVISFIAESVPVGTIVDIVA